MTCDKTAVWDVEMQRSGRHVLICKNHKSKAAIDLSKKSELLMRPIDPSKSSQCAYVLDGNSDA